MFKVKNLDELHLCGGETIDMVVEKLLEAKKDGRKAYCVFNGVTLLSETVTLDSAYKEIYGATKEEWMKQLEKERQEIIEKTKIKEAKAIERIPEQIRRGKELVYPFRFDEWARAVTSSAVGAYHGDTIEDTLEVMEAIEDELPMADIVEIFSKQGHSGWTASLVRTYVMTYSKNGFPFYKATHHGKWTAGECENLLQIMQENEEASLELRLAAEATKSKKELEGKQKRLIKQEENKNKR